MIAWFVFPCCLGKGSRRAIVIEDREPLGPEPKIRYRRGWLCGWTPHGMCFSPYYYRDINYFYVIPFEYVLWSVFCDQAANLNSRRFGLNVMVIAKFSRATDKSAFWQAYVRGYMSNAYGHVISLQAQTFFPSWGVNQITETFRPNQVWLRGI